MLSYNSKSFLQSENCKDFFYAVFVALLFIFFKGYHFNCADQEEHLPQVYKLLDPSLYQYDYFVSVNEQTFTIRFFFVKIVYFLSLLMPVSVTCFLLHVLLLSLTTLSIIKVTRLFFTNQSAHLISPVLTLIVFNSWTVGGNNMEDTQLTCSVFANVFCSWAIYFFFKKNYPFSFILSGLACLFQLLMGLHLFIIFFIILGLNKEAKLKNILLYTLLFLISSGSMLFPILMKQFAARQVYDADLFYNALYFFRNPNHYIPSCFPATDYLKFFTFSIAGLIAIRTCSAKPFKKSVFHFYFIVMAGLLVYWIVFEVFEWHFIGRIQWFKTTVWLGLLSSIWLSIFISNFLKLPVIRLKWFYSLGASVILITVILNSKWLPIEKMKSRYHVGNYQKSELTLMHEWIEKNTSKDEIILTSPDDESFLCEAKRSLPIGFKAVIHEPEFMISWYRNYTALYQLPQKKYSSTNEIISIAKEHFNKGKISHVEQIHYWNLMLIEFDKDTQLPFNYNILHKQGKWILIKEYVPNL